MLSWLRLPQAPVLAPPSRQLGTVADSLLSASALALGLLHFASSVPLRVTSWALSSGLWLAFVALNAAVDVPAVLGALQLRRLLSRVRAWAVSLAAWAWSLVTAPVAPYVARIMEAQVLLVQRFAAARTVARARRAAAAAVAAAAGDDGHRDDDGARVSRYMWERRCRWVHLWHFVEDVHVFSDPACTDPIKLAHAHTHAHAPRRSGWRRATARCAG